VAAVQDYRYAGGQTANAAAGIACDEGVSIPWRTVLALPNLWAILVVCFTYGYTGYIYITRSPTYVNEERHPSTTMTGLVAGLPLALGMPAKPLGGWWSDHAVRARGLVYGRRLVGMKRAGTAPARMLTAGSLWNALSAIAFGTFLHYTGSWIPPFVIAMPANLTGAPLWLKINPGDQLT
jgi:hypothetical protein